MASGTGTTKETRLAGPLKLPEVGWSHLMFACSSLVTTESASLPKPVYLCGCSVGLLAVSVW